MTDAWPTIACGPLVGLLTEGTGEPADWGAGGAGWGAGGGEKAKYPTATIVPKSSPISASGSVALHRCGCFPNGFPANLLRNIADAGAQPTQLAHGNGTHTTMKSATNITREEVMHRRQIVVAPAGATLMGCLSGLGKRSRSERWQIR